MNRRWLFFAALLILTTLSVGDAGVVDVFEEASTAEAAGEDELTQVGSPDETLEVTMDSKKKKAAAVIKPLISKAAKIRAKMERVHMEGSQKKRVKTTIMKKKRAAAKEHNHKLVIHAKAKF